MTKQEIFKHIITILRPETLRRQMEFDIVQAERIIKEKVQEVGLTFVGIGMYAVVVEHPNYPERVFKVTTSRWDGYREYAKYCIANKGKKFLPVIHSANEKGNFGWYELDKYYPILDPNGGYEAFVSIYVEDMYAYAHAGQYSDSVKDLEGRPEAIEIYKRAKEIADLYKNSFTLDIHTGNIMLSKDGEVIITDPLAADVRREIPVSEADPEFD
ncbi:hypothetical protein AB6W40_002616 [Salmonella enterica]